MSPRLFTRVRDDVKLQHQDTIRGVCTDIKLYFKTFNEAAVRNLTINYTFSEMATELLGDWAFVTSSTVTPSRQPRYPAETIQCRKPKNSDASSTVTSWGLLHEWHSSSYKSCRSRHSLIRKPQVTSVWPHSDIVFCCQSLWRLCVTLRRQMTSPL